MLFIFNILKAFTWKYIPPTYGVPAPRFDFAYPYISNDIPFKLSFPYHMPREISLIKT